jgi:hypothetical protein
MYGVGSRYLCKNTDGLEGGDCVWENFQFNISIVGVNYYRISVAEMTFSDLVKYSK